MRVLWTLMKVGIALVLAIPAIIIVLAVTLGVFGALLGLAIMALRLAVIGLIIYGGIKLLRALLRVGKPRRETAKELPPIDPYYEAAKRELDRELGDVRP